MWDIYLASYRKSSRVSITIVTREAVYSRRGYCCVTKNYVVIVLVNYHSVVSNVKAGRMAGTSGTLVTIGLSTQLAYEIPLLLLKFTTLSTAAASQKSYVTAEGHALATPLCTRCPLTGIKSRSWAEYRVDRKVAATGHLQGVTTSATSSIVCITFFAMVRAYTHSW